MAEEEGKTLEFEQQLESAMCARLQHFNDQAESLTLVSVRRLLEKDLGLEKFALDAHKRFIRLYLQKKMDDANDCTSETATKKAEKDVPSKEAKIMPKQHETKIDKKKSSSGDEEIMEDSPIMGVLSESNIKKAIWRRADHFHANSENITLAGVRRLLEEDLGLKKNTLDPFKKFISQQIDEVLASPKGAKNVKDVKKKAVNISKAKKSKKVGSEEGSDSSRKLRKEVASKRNIKKSEQSKKRKISEENDLDISGKKRQKPVKRKNGENDNDEDGSLPEDGQSHPYVEKLAQRKEKPVSGYGKKVENLKSIIKACGMSVSPSIYKKAKQAPEEEREAFIVKELEGILSREGLSKNPTEKGVVHEMVAEEQDIFQEEEQDDIPKARTQRKCRGPSKGVTTKEPMFLEWNAQGVPDGKWSKEFGKQVGSCVTRININVKEYPKLDKVIRKGFWDETKLMFHIEDDNKGKREKYFQSSMAKRFRDFKSKLVRRYITKKEKPPKSDWNKIPWEVYEHIEENDWRIFVEEYNKPESQMRSENARNSALQNKHKHRLGQRGYNRMRPLWIQDGRLPLEAASISSLSSNSSMNSSITTTLERVKWRAQEWILAHEVRTADGKWEVDPNDKEAVEIAAKARQFMEDAKEGKLVFDRGEDALTMAMGKKDHYGRVKAVGGHNVGYKAVFGPLDKRSRSSCNEPSAEVIDAIRNSVRLEFEGELEKRVQEALQKQLATMMPSVHYFNEGSAPHSPPTPVGYGDSNPSPNELPIQPDQSSHPQPRQLQCPTSCRLALDKETNSRIIVAYGVAYPFNGVFYQQSCPFRPMHYKVQVDDVVEGHDDDILPVPTGDGYSNLGMAKNGFVQWPSHLVLFEEEEEIPQQKKKAKSRLPKELLVKNKVVEAMMGSCEYQSLESKAKRKTTSIGMPNEVIQGLGPACKKLKYLLSSSPPGIYDSTTIPLSASVWHFEKDTSTWLSEADIHEFLRGACANISVVYIFMLYLLEEHTYAFEKSRNRLICPQSISSTEVKADTDRATKYLKEMFIAETKKKAVDKMTRFFLAPYFQENHWTLYVIDLRRGCAYYFDSAMDPTRERENDIKTSLSVAFQYYKMEGGVCPKGSSSRVLRTIHMNCAQQIGAVECGYYVMRFMLEIVTQHHDAKDPLDKVWHARDTSYTNEEVDVVREQWARFLTNKYLLS